MQYSRKPHQYYPDEEVITFHFTPQDFKDLANTTNEELGAMMRDYFNPVDQDVNNEK